MITSPSAQVPTHTTEDFNVNLTIGDRTKEAGNGYFRGCIVRNWQFLALPYRMVNEACAYFRTLIQVQPIITRMPHPGFD